MFQNPQAQKVTIYILIIYILFIQGPGNPKYKMTLCKHYDTPQGCSYGDKCQFAHGAKELRNNGQGFQQMPMGNMAKGQNNLLNYKIVKF